MTEERNSILKELGIENPDEVVIIPRRNRRQKKKSGFFGAVLVLTGLIIVVAIVGLGLLQMINDGSNLDHTAQLNAQQTMTAKAELNPIINALQATLNTADLPATETPLGTGGDGVSDIKDVDLSLLNSGNELEKTASVAMFLTQVAYLNPETTPAPEMPVDPAGMNQLSNPPSNPVSVMSAASSNSAEVSLGTGGNSIDTLMYETARVLDPTIQALNNSMTADPNLIAAFSDFLFAYVDPNTGAVMNYAPTRIPAVGITPIAIIPLSTQNAGWYSGPPYYYYGSTSGALPTTGFADEVGIPGLAGLAGLFIFVIFMARRLRSI